jgi:quercetin dioxygenase-like cupin family protein
MARAGADIVVAHMGVTTGGSIGATSAKTLAECVVEIDRMAEAARRIRTDVIVLCHGGPIAMPADAEFVLQNCSGCHGFYGASSMERLPVEAAVTEQTRRFKSLTFGPGKGHAFHKHPDQEEVIYVVAGRVEQWVDTEKRLLGPGDSVFLPPGMVHASFNVGETDVHIVAILGPCVGESGYEVVEVAGEAPWSGLRA